MLIVPNAVGHLSVFYRAVTPGRATIIMILVDLAVLVHPVVRATVVAVGIKHCRIKR